jgi:hypothetical protein
LWLGLVSLPQTGLGSGAEDSPAGPILYAASDRSIGADLIDINELSAFRAAKPARAAPRTSPQDIPVGATVETVWIWQETNDCLWNMAKEHYGNPYLWPRIYEANRHLIKDPQVIFPKQKIVIPPLDAAARPRTPVPVPTARPAARPSAPTPASSQPAPPRRERSREELLKILKGEPVR